ncbi:hypothetical protein EDB81DRAFT_778929 [Dactylonectria macrodidyma]|uniref:Clr5 domain-containing protein n=1 Tax=Dactylonectria macrodidyma TaxID=307937 RepID=A0A9P9FL68_9HYPO|nr:hypothetical protein EDB81DRAFT_778929 [Dactylonectria macrodidyma]
MDRVPEKLLPKSDREKFLHVPYKDRWNHLKPVIVSLYMGTYPGALKSATLDQVVQFMRTHYSFHAAQSEYPPRFRAWRVSKRIVRTEKEGIVTTLGKRKQPGTSTSQITVRHGDMELAVDAKKLKRYLKGKRPSVEAIMPGFFSSWSLPYKAFISSLSKPPDHASPFGHLESTPAYLNIRALTPGRAFDSPSPTMKLVYQNEKQDLASLFLQGRLMDFVKNINPNDRRTSINYFHDFYLHSFLMAKEWGLEPLSTDFSSDPSTSDRSSEIDLSVPPTQLCKWSVHEESDTDGDIEEDSPRSSFVDSLHNSITSNSFTNTPTDDLPLAQEIVVQTLEAEPKTLELDAWKLAIMAANAELLEDLFKRNNHCLPKGFENFHPFHFAAAFIDGGNKCCEVITSLHLILEPTYAFHHNEDDLGHTILDAFIVSILRSHTSLKPEFVSHGFHSSNRFPGEEKDICGRWDADTPQVRELFKEGYHRIPTKWKHAFCHTAVQAICHSIITIFASPSSPNINALSGLFLRRCTECGMELKLGPLHVIAMTAFYLAESGMRGETLFGALAVMTCLLTLGADESLKVNVSVDKILGAEVSGECHHPSVSALELMQAIPNNIFEGWTEDCQTGWVCLLQTLVRVEAEKDWRPPGNTDESLGSDASGDWDQALEPSANEVMGSQDDSSETSLCIIGCHDELMKLPCRGPAIGLIWATIQGELLTYRRVWEEDAWISINFSMKALRTWLEGDSPTFLTPLVQDPMLQDHSRCGWFYDDGLPFFCAVAGDICVRNFTNMPISSDRMSFIIHYDPLKRLGMR